jgi:hypothetical protein
MLNDCERPAFGARQARRTFPPAQDGQAAEAIAFLMINAFQDRQKLQQW